MATANLRSAYNRLQKKKRAYCNGRTTKSEVKQAYNKYVTSAVSKGQTKTEAQRKGKKVLNRGCSMSSSIKAKKGARKRKTAKKSTRKRTTAKK